MKSTGNAGLRGRVGRGRRRGNIIIYTVVALPALFAIASLAVDLGQAQLIKSELQRCADATARGYIAIRIAESDTNAQAKAPAIATMNTVDANSGISPTVTIQRGWWNSSSQKFNTGSGSGPFAVKVTISRTAATSNPVKLTWGALVGRANVDVDAVAIAVHNISGGGTFTVPANGDPWLAGMPNGSSASYDDYAPANSPKQITIPVTPGQYITFSNITGQAAHGPTLGQYDPEGEINNMFTHNMDVNEPAVENGIGDVKMPIGAFMGVFLDNNAPNLSSAPNTVRDYSTTASRQQEFYDDILNKQPFYIGDGKTGTGTGSLQKFKVPAGATRLFVSMMDGHEWSNNVGNFTVTVKSVESVQLVQ